MQSLEKLKPLALLLLRCGIGLIFLVHGYAKLTHIPQWLQNFEKMAFPSYFAYIAGVLETFGGLLLVIGFFTRIAGLLLAIEMAIAIWRVHFHSVFVVHDYEFPLALGLGALALAAVGAGVISLDYAIFRDKA
jgi:putative oxidoreductase